MADYKPFATNEERITELEKQLDRLIRRVSELENGRVLIDELPAGQFEPERVEWSAYSCMSGNVIKPAPQND